MRLITSSPGDLGERDLSMRARFFSSETREGVCLGIALNHVCMKGKIVSTKRKRPRDVLMTDLG